LIVEAKYVGDDSSIQSVEDIQDISLGGKIDWSTVTASYTFPMYGAKLPRGYYWFPIGPLRPLVGDAPERLVSAHATPIKDTMGNFAFGTGVYAHPVSIQTATSGNRALEQKIGKPIYLFKKMN